MDTKTPESEQSDSTKKKQEDRNKKVFLLLTKRRQVRKINDEIDELITDICLYRDKE